jgi:hypothetical protein
VADVDDRDPARREAAMSAKSRSTSSPGDCSSARPMSRTRASPASARQISTIWRAGARGRSAACSDGSPDAASRRAARERGSRRGSRRSTHDAPPRCRGRTLSVTERCGQSESS